MARPNPKARYTNVLLARDCKQHSKRKEFIYEGSRAEPGKIMESKGKKVRVQKEFQDPNGTDRDASGTSCSSSDHEKEKVLGFMKASRLIVC